MNIRGIRNIRRMLGIPSTSALRKSVGLPSVSDVKKVLGIKYKSQVLKSVNILKILGYKVSYRKRTDGGYLINKINGKSFKGAKGNAVARMLTNERISTKSLQANRRNVLRAIPKLRKPITKYSGEKLFRKVQGALREAVKLGETYEISRDGKKVIMPKFSGKITIKGYRELVAKEGIKKAEESLRNLWSKTHKLAYKESVLALRDRLEFATKRMGIKSAKLDMITEFLSNNDISESQKQEILSMIPDDSLTDADTQAMYDGMEESEKWESALDSIIEILGI